MRVRIVILVSAVALLAVFAPSASYATKYGAGKYGRCQYQTCSITLSSSSSVNIDVVPSGSGTRCSVASDTVTVTTSSSTGFNVTLADADASTSLTTGGNSIARSSGTSASPTTLSDNTWGYRLDNFGNFGAGPTGAISSAAAPTTTFAGIQASTGTADTIVNSSVAATGGASSKVWYGVCVNAGQASGAYGDSVVYTALVN